MHRQRPDDARVVAPAAAVSMRRAVFRNIAGDRLRGALKHLGSDSTWEVA